VSDFLVADLLDIFELAFLETVLFAAVLPFGTNLMKVPSAERSIR
jgi:hypothetical protein